MERNHSLVGSALEFAIHKGRIHPPYHSSGDLRKGHGDRICLLYALDPQLACVERRASRTHRLCPTSKLVTASKYEVPRGESMSRKDL